MRFATSRITTDCQRPELAYIESFLAVDFVFDAASPMVRYRIGDAGQFDGAATWTHNSSLIFGADIVIESAFQSQAYLFLHELGHVLGLPHADGLTSLADTLMLEYDVVNGRYTRAEVESINEYTLYDRAQLWERYGIAPGFQGPIEGSRFGDFLPGRPIDEIFIGGDGNDTIRAGKGNDAIYGNKGDDVIYGGMGIDTIHGGQGNDTIYASAGDTVMPSLGEDFIIWV